MTTKRPKLPIKKLFLAFQLFCVRYPYDLDENTKEAFAAFFDYCEGKYGE